MTKKNGSKSPKKHQIRTRQDLKAEKTHSPLSITDAAGSSKSNKSPDIKTPSIDCGVVDPNQLKTADIASTLQLLVENQGKIMQRLSDIEMRIFESNEEATDRHGLSTDILTSSLDVFSAEIKENVEQITANLTTIPLTQSSGQKRTMKTESGCTDCPDQHGNNLDDGTEELTKIILKEKREKSLKEQCTKTKRTIGLQWTQLLHNRRKFYGNFVKNYRKSTLYTQWMENSPDFIPLKYRPKRIPGEMPSVTTAKVKEAKLRYKNDVNAMIEYSKVHQARVQSIDGEMYNLISHSCKNEEETTALQEMWQEETLILEERAAQAWLKTERFLSRKKHDDENKQEATLAAMSWAEILSRRSKKKPTIHQNTQHNFPYYTQLP